MQLRSPQSTASDTLAGPDPSIRWAGAALMLASSVLIATFLVYTGAYGSPAGTGPGGSVTLQDRGAHALAHWTLVSRIWRVEAFAWIALAVAGLTLQASERGGSRWLPGRVAWIVVGVGALIQSLMYAFMVGGYPASAAVVDSAPALFEAFNGAAWFLFGLANIVVFAGQAGVLFGEAAPGGRVPRWVALGGGAICGVEAGLFLGLLGGVVGMAAAGPGALLGTLAMVWLGIGIWRRG